MSDFANEVAEPDLVAEGAGIVGATSSISDAEAPGGQYDEKSSPGAALLLKAWSAIMLLSTLVLSFYVIILKDNSATPFVVLGMIGLCLPSIVNMFREMARNKQLRIEREERIRKAAMERMAQVKERERRRQELEKSAAANAAAETASEHEALRNFDVEAYKINSSRV